MYISGHGMAMKNECILVMIWGRNDMEDELAEVEHGVESAIDMAFLLAGGHTLLF